MKPGRNDPCPCGSGKKYKKCCAPKEDAAHSAELAAQAASRAAAPPPETAESTYQGKAKKAANVKGNVPRGPAGGPPKGQTLIRRRSV